MFLCCLRARLRWRSRKGAGLSLASRGSRSLRYINRGRGTYLPRLALCDACLCAKFENLINVFACVEMHVGAIDVSVGSLFSCLLGDGVIPPCTDYLSGEL